ncbi:MAG TPA: hypothetical protein VGJ94_15560 [Syntrophorhabdaceae bacterium]|jgi:hypothetical protein
MKKLFTRYGIPSFRRSAIGLMMALMLAGFSYAYIPMVEHPLSSQDCFVSIIFFPFEEQSGEDGGADLRRRIVSHLGKSPAFEYIIYYPNPAKMEILSNVAFARTKSDQVWPNPEFWHESQIHYVVFGRYVRTGDEVRAEVFLYQVREEQMLMFHKYRAPIDRFQEMAAKIASRIEERLLANEPDAKRRHDAGGTK